MKIALICSHGGHLTETLQLLEAFASHSVFFASYHSAREAEVRALAPAYFTQNIGTSVWRMARAVPWAWSVLRRERPDVIVSLGAEIALPFFYLGRLLGMRTIFIESWCRVESVSLTGRLVRPVASLFLVQWPQLLELCPPGARYEGAVL